jgi:hypothetical protein
MINVKVNSDFNHYSGSMSFRADETTLGVRVLRRFLEFGRSI